MPRCSGGLTSAISANQFGELAEVSASASERGEQAQPTDGSVTTLASTAPTTAPPPAPSGTSMRSGTKNNTR